MASQEGQAREPVDIAYHDERDTRIQPAKNRPMPTDSMVTVRLSDTSGVRSLRISMSEDAPLPKSVGDSVEASRPRARGDSNATIEIDGQDVNEIADVVPLSEQYRESIMSVTSIQEEETLASAGSTIRSRSDSSGTLSSNGSAQVDWDELEKSEEQAPRDGGSDEVGIAHFFVSFFALIRSLVNGLSSSST